MHRTFFPLIVGAMAMFAATIAARQDTQREAATVKQVMVTMTIPASEAIFSAASETPKDAKAWQDVRKAAVALAESGNLLIAGGLAKDSTTWIDMARALVTQAQATLNAIDAKDGDALAQVGDDVYATCETCHDRYMGK
jgi:hypothetical protein